MCIFVQFLQLFADHMQNIAEKAESVDEKRSVWYK